MPQLVNAFYVITKNEIGEYEISQSKNTVTWSPFLESPETFRAHFG